MQLKKIVVSDVDGVLNTGQFLYDENGKRFKVFGPHDADGIKLLNAAGFKMYFISADKRGFEITKSRLNDMGQDPWLITESERLDWINQMFNIENIIYIGDGYHDAPILASAGFGIAPKYARKEAKENATFITESNSGEGAFLDAALEILYMYESYPQVFI